MPSYIHSDRGTSFLSQELKDYLSQRGIATSKSTPYHPIGNGQVERYNGIIWKTVRLSLKSKILPDPQWEVVLPDALHSIRSLLSTSTNTTPHERFYSFQRRSSCGTPMPSWLHSQDPSCSGDSSEQAKMILLWTKWSYEMSIRCMPMCGTWTVENPQFLFVTWLLAHLSQWMLQSIRNQIPVTL